jgi:hypothetical protein
MSVEGQGPDASRQYFHPFPAASSTLIVAPPYTGKSYFVKQLLESQELYFEKPVTRVVVINCDERVKFYELEEPKAAFVDEGLNGPFQRRQLPRVEQYVWDTFDSGTLEEGDVVLVDDLQVITPRVRELITALAHHCFLGHLFVICHGVLGTRMYELLSYVHRVCLFTASTAVVRLGLYIVQRFYVDPELKEFLKKVIGICERQQEILILEINNLPGNVQPYHVALSHLTKLKNPDASFAMAYSYPSRSGLYEKLAREKRITRVSRTLLEALPSKEYLPQGSFLILNPSNVQELKDKEAREKEEEEDGVPVHEGESEGDCLRKQSEEWDQAVSELESRIEDFVDPKGGKWLLAKNLLKEILRNSNICIMENRKEMMLLEKESTRVSVLDFITNAIRRAGPTEKETRGNSSEYRLYRLYVESLLNNLCPKILFKNKLFLSGRASSPSVRHWRKSKKSKKSKSHSRRRSGSRKRRTRDSSSDYDGDNESSDEYEKRRRRSARSLAVPDFHKPILSYADL